MRNYSNKISLTKNSRGIYSLDPSFGCNSGLNYEKNGCYGDCYAAKSSKLYGYDFSKTVLRYFENEYHRRKIVSQINKIPLDFIRMGTMGDPSENWDHTIDICKKIKSINKEIVIITRHWTKLNDNHLEFLSNANICINTSISALDDNLLLENCLTQYNLLKKYCKSVLRIVSCDFNKENESGLKLSKVQELLFKNDSIIDTVLRISKNNKYYKKSIINVKKTKFLGKNAIVSKYNKKTYFGKCSSCLEMCGLNVKVENKIYPEKKGILKQLKIF
jgi:hypothetical protein